MESVHHSLLLLICCLASGVVSQDCETSGVVAVVDIHVGVGNPGEIPGNIGNPLVMRCDIMLSVAVGPEPIIQSYIWTQNGESQNDFIGQTLSIQNLQSSDGGDYQCRAVTDSCTTKNSDITTVTTPPTVTVDPMSSFSMNEGDSFNLTCQAEGWPQPSIEWFRVTDNNTLELISQSAVLAFPSASLTDGGQYTCIATNSRDNARRVITVTVIEVTEAPTEITTTEVTTVTEDTNVPGSTSGRPETEDGFYIGVAVAAFVCLVLTVTTIIFVIIWAVYRNSAAQGYAEDHYEESVVMGPVDMKGDEQPVVVPWPQPESKKRPKHKF